MSLLPGGMPSPARDLTGYGENPPDPHWPGGAKLALSFVVNVEEGAELSLLSGDERNEAIPEAAQRLEGVPDPGMESHFDYGARVGLWRVLRAFDRHGLKATFSCCGRAIAATPLLAAEPHARGHEISAHGWRWEVQAGMEEATERAVIAATVAAIRDATGERPVGWHSKSAASVNTRRLLLEDGGFLYDSDAYDDELPRRLPGRAHVVMPYCFDTNDMRFAPGGGFLHAEDFSRYCISAIDWMLAQPGPGRMLSIGLHLRLIARPARMPGLEAVLAHVARRPEIWVARRRDIARHWLSLGV
ncbi:polysaccharide deacetylase family protein [Rhodovarius lipocyclicus]|uniref:polysaccharide deacetylase family protein n=1 Tax=Rhodovarius lipocyclicus TaxID=268410 RepID=UPI00191763A4|nr:polysaccharide deacetylase family protein [Rhodovarius lipocyclicus]